MTMKQLWLLRLILLIGGALAASDLGAQTINSNSTVAFTILS
jgi:hypothetical protein